MKGKTWQQRPNANFFEELGIKNVELVKISPQTFCYDWPEAKRPVLFNFYKFRGQQQHLVYLNFGQDDEIIPTNMNFPKPNGQALKIL